MTGSKHILILVKRMTYTGKQSVWIRRQAQILAAVILSCMTAIPGIAAFNPPAVNEPQANTAHERRKSLGPYTMYEQIVYKAKQQRILTWLADDMNKGRASGTRDCQRAAWYIADRFRTYGLVPLFGDSFFQPFPVLTDENCVRTETEDSDTTDFKEHTAATAGRNVVGVIRAAVPSDEYVLITAHYDHLGVLDGNIYNGADDNASGVTVLLNLADMFGTMRKTKTGPDKNIIFAALDAKELNMAGSKALVHKLLSEEESTAYTTSYTTDPTAATAADWADSANSLEEDFPGIPKDRIICAINIDQIGTVLEPVHEADTNFVIVLGENTLHKKHRGLIDMCNRYYRLGLNIDHTFYGSEKFTDLFYRLSDQIVFHEAGIPALHLRLPPPHLQDHRRPGHHLLPRHEKAHAPHLLPHPDALTPPYSGMTKYFENLRREVIFAANSTSPCRSRFSHLTVPPATSRKPSRRYARPSMPELTP